MVGYASHGDAVAGFLPDTLPPGAARSVVGVALAYHTAVSYLLTAQPLHRNVRLWLFPRTAQAGRATAPRPDLSAPRPYLSCRSTSGSSRAPPTLRRGATRRRTGPSSRSGLHHPDRASTAPWPDLSAERPYFSWALITLTRARGAGEALTGLQLHPDRT